jgi:hypothetical protein
VAGGREVTGSPPVPVASVDQKLYRRGGQVRARVDITDPDNRVEPMVSDGTDPGDGTAVHIVEQRYHSDIPKVLWRYQGTTATLGTGLTLTLLAPARSVVLEAVVTDAQGHTVVTSVPVTVQSLALGVDVDTSSTPAFWLSELTQVITGKHPDGPTKLFQPTGMPVVGKYLVPASMTPHYTFAQLPTEAAFRTWVASLTGPAWVTPVQEIDRKLSLADAVAAYTRIGSWMDSAPAGVQLVPNLTASWQENPDPGKGQGQQWSAWAEAFAAIPGITTLGVDMYVGGQSGYRPITAQLDPAVAAATAAGLDLVVPEFGVVVPLAPTAANLDERAAWITATLAAFQDAGVLAASWWNAPPTSQKGTFRLAQGDPGWDALRAGLAT